MIIRRKNRHGLWDTLAVSNNFYRVPSNFGTYLYEMTNERNPDKTLYQLELSETELQTFTAITLQSS